MMLRGLVPRYPFTHGSLDTRIRVDTTVYPLILYLSRVCDVMVIFGTAMIVTSAYLPSPYPVVPTVVLPRCHNRCFDLG